MKTKTIYICDLCGKEFNDPQYNDPDMSLLKFEVIGAAYSTSNRHLTIGENGQDIALCGDCTNKVIKALKKLGIKNLYEGCSTVQI